MEALSCRLVNPLVVSSSNLPRRSQPISHARRQLNCPVISAIGGHGWRHFPSAREPRLPGVFLLDAGDGSYIVTRMANLTSKWLVAKEMNDYKAIGFDLVASALNGMVTSGARPLFFVYNTLLQDDEVLDDLISGVIDGCLSAGCRLTQGSRKKTPGSLVSGMAFGQVRKEDVLDGTRIVEGDWLIGLSTNAVHSNKFVAVLSTLAYPLPGAGQSIGQALLASTHIYAGKVLDMVAKGGVKGVAHIGADGLTDGIAKVLPTGLGAAIKVGSWPLPAVIQWLREVANVGDEQMYRTFNMGMEMILVAEPPVAYKILENFDGPAHFIGKVTRGGGVLYE